MARSQLDLTRDALRQLYTFHVQQLDPDPAPIGDYLVGGDVIAAARAAIGDADRPSVD
jgi:hypothetical protein